MAQIIEVSGREFRANPKTYFKYADQQGAYILMRDKKRKASYLLAPMKEGEEPMSPALLERIELCRQEIREGKTTRYTPKELKERMRRG